MTKTELRVMHLRERMEAIDQEIVDIYWRGFPVIIAWSVIHTGVGGISLHMLSLEWVKFLVIAALCSMWTCVAITTSRLMRAVMKYRREWKRWPRFGGSR